MRRWTTLGIAAGALAILTAAAGAASELSHPGWKPTDAYVGMRAGVQRECQYGPMCSAYLQANDPCGTGAGTIVCSPPGCASEYTCFAGTCSLDGQFTQCTDPSEIDCETSTITTCGDAPMGSCKNTPVNLGTSPACGGNQRTLCSANTDCIPKGGQIHCSIVTCGAPHN